jgi:hypothetical protein
LIVGVQALIWTLTGLYMTVVRIDIIHGDHFIRQAEAKPVRLSEIVSPLEVAKAAPDAKQVRLAWLLGRAIYIAATPAGETLFDAQSGQRLAPPSRDVIRELAEHWFTGPEKLVRLELITKVPGEIRGREPPLWRAEFNGWNKPTLYLSPATGQLLSRRHELWRIFDFLWMLHIMDYETRDDVNNWLLRGFTLLAFTTVLSGAWLLWFAFPRKRQKPVAR